MKKLALIALACAALTLTACQTTEEKAAMAAKEATMMKADDMKGEAMKDGDAMKDTMKDTMKS